jgi:hypothetical protein
VVADVGIEGLANFVEEATETVEVEAHGGATEAQVMGDISCERGYETLGDDSPTYQRCQVVSGQQLGLVRECRAPLVELLNFQEVSLPPRSPISARRLVLACLVPLPAPVCGDPLVLEPGQCSLAAGHGLQTAIVSIQAACLGLGQLDLSKDSGDGRRLVLGWATDPTAGDVTGLHHGATGPGHRPSPSSATGAATGPCTGWSAERDAGLASCMVAPDRLRDVVEHPLRPRPTRQGTRPTGSPAAQGGCGDAILVLDVPGRRPSGIVRGFADRDRLERLLGLMSPGWCHGAGWPLAEVYRTRVVVLRVLPAVVQRGYLPGLGGHE